MVRVVVGPEPNPGDAVLHRGRVWSQTPAPAPRPQGTITLSVNP